MFKSSPSPADLVARAQVALESAIQASSSTDVGATSRENGNNLSYRSETDIEATPLSTSPQQTILSLSSFLPSAVSNDQPIPEGKNASYYYALLAEQLSSIKIIFYGEAEQLPNQTKSLEMRSAIVSSPEIFVLLIRHLRNIPFQARKDAAAIYSHLTRQDILDESERSDAHTFSAYILSRYDVIIEPLINGYSDPDIALICGSMFRSTTSHLSLYKKILCDARIWIFFDEIVHMPNFDIVSDAFETIATLLTREKNIAAEFLSRNYDVIFPKYEKMLQSSNYITRRLSLKLLGELLLDRVNFSTMMQYISSRKNLITLMNLLSDPSGNIQFEAVSVPYFYFSFMYAQPPILISM
mmetsp:Transcript_33067/g.76202  ORF Transcript_33067/g.76202 Transcript_33067/m.76202 type:complete len:355 (-) Transcript_33067:290-1354(-)